MSILFAAVVCNSITPNSPQVINRTSSMFTALIDYNCSFSNASELVVHNSTPAICSISETVRNQSSQGSTVNVTCMNIQNGSGRNWRFGISSRQSFESIDNESFIITLQPLRLNYSTNITIVVDTNLRSVSISIWKCNEIAEPNYLVVQCGNQSNRPILINCTQKCNELLPGSRGEVVLLRLPIEAIDNNEIFPNESIKKSYIIGEKEWITKKINLILITCDFYLRS